MFSKILHPAHLDDVIQSSTAESLALISILTKISNSPILLKAAADNAKGKNKATASIQRKGVCEALQHLPERTHIADVKLSGKFK
jgi:DNA repair and recombination protein RAD54B